jgi:hypothetical protein
MLAAEEAAKRTKRKLRLVFYGYYKPADMEPKFLALAKDICQTVACTFISNTDPRFPDGLWAAADIFASLSENIQESFGLTPIEAMACGLPVVVTNWDGYRESVEQGVCGYQIDTVMPPASVGLELAQDYYNTKNYGNYLASAAQSTAVNIAQAAEAFVTLAEDDEKRRLMGEAGRARARAIYDWRVIIPSYKELWQHLAEQRHAQKEMQPLPLSWAAAHPHYPNPWKLFETFPTRTLAPTDVLSAVMSASDIRNILGHEMNFFMPAFLFPVEGLLGLVEIIRQNGHLSIQNILASCPTPERARLWRSLGWLLKHGAVRIG